MASYKVEICLKKKKPTPSTNIPLLSYRKSEQKLFIFDYLFEVMGVCKMSYHFSQFGTINAQCISFYNSKAKKSGSKIFPRKCETGN